MVATNTFPAVESRPIGLRERYERLVPRRPDVETTTPSGRRLRIVYPRVRRTRHCDERKA
ncbi:MAG TPA: hypothetical protein VFC93_02475 [Chloroflexota bacterium]|nr:hypothetical protein [Chloroflexota bacterium]